jgi:hypothetical protein
MFENDHFQNCVYFWCFVVCLSGTGSFYHVTVMGSLIVLVNKRADWNMPVSYIKYMSLCSALWFILMAKQTNRRKRTVFNETHLQIFFFENWRTTKLCEKKRTDIGTMPWILKFCIIYFKSIVCNCQMKTITNYMFT